MNLPSLTGSAGVYFVAARLNAMGLQCAPTFGNVPSVDILVSNLGGSAMVSLQVKTTMFAMRPRGRGENKKPYEYQWAIGWKSARLNTENLFFALVDLKEFAELPDVFIVPSKMIATYFEGGDPKTWTFARYHELIETLTPHKNNWDTIRNRLAELDSAVVPSSDSQTSN
jgi:hypothetical protein